LHASNVSVKEVTIQQLMVGVENSLTATKNKTSGRSSLNPGENIGIWLHNDKNIKLLFYYIHNKFELD